VGLRPALLITKMCTRLAAASDKVYQLFAHARWIPPNTPASSTTKASHHDIAEILLKVALSTINQITKSIINFILAYFGHHVNALWFSSSKDFYVIWLSYILNMSVPTEGYSRHASCAHN
jgi:hypothetical protein